MFLLFGCDDRGELRTVCLAFAALEGQSGLDEMGTRERMAFVNERVEGKLSRFGRVAPLWRLIPSFESEARYRMFKRSADELVGNWNCPVMKKLAPSLSEPVEEGAY